MLVDGVPAKHPRRTLTLVRGFAVVLNFFQIPVIDRKNAPESC